MKKHLLKFGLLWLLPFLLLTSCGRDKDPEPGKYENGFLIVNEGNFSDSDGELSFYDYGSRQSRHNLFELENARPLAAIIQKVRLTDNRLMMVCNRVDKVEVVDKDLKSLITISSDGNNMVNPQDVAVAGDQLFITCWGPFNASFQRDRPFIALANLASGQITGRIDLPGFPQDILNVGGRIIVALTGANKIVEISPSSRTIIREVNTPASPTNLIQKGGDIWVRCRQAMVNLRLSDFQVAHEVVAPWVMSGAVADPKQDRILVTTSVFAPDFSFSDGTVYAFQPGSRTFATSALAARRNLYGVAVDPADGSLLLMDANNFRGAGSLIRLNASGAQAEVIEGGRGPKAIISIRP